MLGSCNSGYKYKHALAVEKLYKEVLFLCFGMVVILLIEYENFTFTGMILEYLHISNVIHKQNHLPPYYILTLHQIQIFLIVSYLSYLSSNNNKNNLLLCQKWLCTFCWFPLKYSKSRALLWTANFIKEMDFLLIPVKQN